MSAHGDKLKEHIEDTLYSTGRFRPEEASDVTQEILKGVEPSESQEELKQLDKPVDGWHFDPKLLHDISHRTDETGWPIGMEEVDGVLLVLLKQFTITRK